LRDSIDNNYSIALFLPIVYLIINNQTTNISSYQIWGILLFLAWLWPFAFICSNSATLFVRATEGLVLHLLVYFAVMYALSNTQLDFLQQALIAFLVSKVFQALITSLASTLGKIMWPLNGIISFLTMPLIFINPLLLIDLWLN
jgi:hypothetical protein